MSRLVHPPANPVANARLFLRNRYTESTNLLLRSHGGVLRVWSGSAWPELHEDELKAEIYLFFEKAEYEVKAKNSAKPVSFHPTRAKVGEIAAAVAAVSHLPDDRVMPFWIEDGDPISNDVPPDELVPVANGLLHVATRKLFPSTPRFFCPFALPYAYTPDAPPPQRFLRFLEELWPGDQESQDLLQEFIGYLLVPDTRMQKMLLLVGLRRSGKGTIGRLLRDLLGHRNVAGPTLASLSTQFGLQPLIDKPVAIIPDARLSGRADNAVTVERLLSITGEDALTIDRKYGSAWTGPLPTRLVMLTNELPRLGDSSGALSSRFLVLQMAETFLGKEDHDLGAKLVKELSGIILWALDGLDRLQDRGSFLQPERSNQILRDLEELSSPIQAFINENCVVEPWRTVGIPDLFEEWKEWCEKNNVLPGTTQTFGRDLRSVVPGLETSQPWRDGVRHRQYKGIGLARDDTRA
jgi:putative DNA primase/helicase